MLNGSSYKTITDGLSMPCSGRGAAEEKNRFDNRSRREFGLRR